MESGSLENGLSIISADKFSELKKFFNLTKLPLFYERLTGYGFSFHGWDGKQKLDGGSSFILEYLDNPNLLTVLKAAADKSHKLKGDDTSKILSDHFYTMNYHLFFDDSNTVPPYSQEDYKKFLGEENYLFVTAFNEYMESKGMKAVWNGLLRIAYIKPNNKEHPECFICYADYKYGLHNDNKLLLRYRFHNVSRYQHIIEKAPEHIRNVFIDNIQCGHCNPTDDSGISKHCDYKVCYVLDNKQYEACIWKGFYFTDLRLNDIEYYKQFYELEYNKK
jgi:hypothetical protein